MIKLNGIVFDNDEKFMEVQQKFLVMGIEDIVKDAKKIDGKYVSEEDDTFLIAMATALRILLNINGNEDVEEAAMVILSDPLSVIEED
jgi:hypothetical protein